LSGNLEMLEKVTVVREMYEKWLFVRSVGEIILSEKHVITYAVYE